MTTESQPAPYVPKRSRWWSLLLGLSLAVNLAFGGVLIGHRVFGGPQGRGAYMQLLPREFFGSLPHERRRELMDMMKQDLNGLRELRGQADVASLRIADALEKQPFDPALVQQAVSEFATGSQSLAARAPVIVANIVRKLTSDERLKLAKSIRDREQKRKKRD
jgi:uncharacterized membrane protein